MGPQSAMTAWNLSSSKSCKILGMVSRASVKSGWETALVDSVSDAWRVKRRMASMSPLLSSDGPYGVLGGASGVKTEVEAICCCPSSASVAGSIGGAEIKRPLNANKRHKHQTDLELG
jgi:hypothetical protein